MECGHHGERNDNGTCCDDVNRQSIHSELQSTAMHSALLCMLEEDNEPYRADNINSIPRDMIRVLLAERNKGDSEVDLLKGNQNSSEHSTYTSLYNKLRGLPQRPF